MHKNANIEHLRKTMRYFIASEFFYDTNVSILIFPP